MIKTFVHDVCDILRVEMPSISFDTSNFLSSTMMAQVDLKKSILYIRKSKRVTPDYFFAIAHELRHIWQYQNDEQYYLSNYRTSNKCKSVEEYNLQIAEVDANAFAAIIMIEEFHLCPQWKGLSDKVVSAIEKRIKIVIHELDKGKRP